MRDIFKHKNLLFEIWDWPVLKSQIVFYYVTISHTFELVYK